MKPVYVCSECGFNTDKKDYLKYYEGYTHSEDCELLIMQPYFAASDIENLIKGRIANREIDLNKSMDEIRQGMLLERINELESLLAALQVGEE